MREKDGLGPGIPRVVAWGGVPTMMLPGTDLQVSKIGLGCVTFGREIDEDAAFEIMDYAVENGINFFDTAAVYGEGSSERIIGRWLRACGLQGRIVVETKISHDFTIAHTRESLDASLDRLGLDQVGVYLLHRFDTTVPLEETLEALTVAVGQGRAQYAGCSNFSAEQLAAALDLSEQQGLTRLRVIQPIYNLAERDIETGLLPLACRRGVAVVTYSPLGAGFLTGKYPPDRAAIPAGSRFDVKPGHADIYFKPENFQIVGNLRRLSDRTGLSMARLAMAWVLQNPRLTTVLVGARTTSHIKNALEALDPLPPQWRAEMDGWRERC